MTRPIRVIAIHKKEPEIRLYVLALMELSRQLQGEGDRTDRSHHRAAKQGREADA
jgi:hypothetical protein